MSYKGWKLMEKLDVAIRDTPGDFTGYIVEHGDKKALESAKDWARTRDYSKNSDDPTAYTEPDVQTFDNGGFTATILRSAGGSSQGGRLSFWMCKVEKDGIEFTIGVNDAILADLIRNSDIKNGVIQQKVMFARQAGKPGLIHEGMETYAEATADMKQKDDLKKAKKTKKWEIGGVYSTLTQTDICLGEVWDTLESYDVEESYSSYRWGTRKTTKYRKLEKPVKMTAWIGLSTYTHKNGLPEDLETFLKEELKDRTYISFSTGTPPARTKSGQLEVKDTDMKLLDTMFEIKHEYGRYGSGEEKTTGRYVREIA